MLTERENIDIITCINGSNPKPSEQPTQMILRYQRCAPGATAVKKGRQREYTAF